MKTNNIKAIIAGIKWTTIILIGLSGWIAFAWLKADLWPNRIDHLPIHRRVEIVAQKPGKGQEWGVYDGAKVRYLKDRTEGMPKSSQKAHGHSGLSSTPSVSSPRDESTQSSLPEESEGVLPLGRFLVPAGGRDPLWVTPELDPVSGETKLQVEPAGGFARFGGERAVGGSFEIWSSSSKRVELFLTQGLGRVGRVEFSATATTAFEVNDLASGVSVGARISMWVPF